MCEHMAMVSCSLAVWRHAVALAIEMCTTAALSGATALHDTALWGEARDNVLHGLAACYLSVYERRRLDRRV